MSIKPLVAGNWKMNGLKAAITELEALAAGFDADLVLWDADPLSARARVQITWVDGKRYFDRKQDLVERQAIKAEKAALIDKILASGEKPAENREGYRPAVVHWHCEDMDNHLEEM